uniref:Testis expressed 13B n=1 Tax=Loxodonta africana TaxID=9785 RepID=G5E6W3_LOXAF
MALNPEDPCGGFHHAKVADFINEKMAGHVKGPEFYIENMSSSWEEVEGKLRAILENSTVSSEAKEACAWGGLALSVRFACRQSHLQGCRVQWLHDFAKLHRSAAQSLAADLKVLTAQQELERKDAASQLQLLRASLAEVQEERDQLRRKLLQAELRQPLERTTGWPTVAADDGAGTEGEGEEEEKAMAAPATTAAADATGGEEERDAAGATTTPATEATRELSGSFLQLLGAVTEKFHLRRAAGGRAQVIGNSQGLFLWGCETWAHSLAGTLSCPTPCLIHILIPLPLILIPRPTRTHTIPTNSHVHSISSTSDGSPSGGL